MAYTEVDAIMSEFKSLTFSGSTPVTDDDVEEFIEQEEAFLNARISKKYMTPITADDSAVSIMKKLSTLLVKARVLDILQVKSGKAETDQGVTGDSLRAQVDTIVMSILDNSMDLNAALAQSNNGVQDYNSNHVKPDNCPIGPLFKRDSNQW